MKPIVRKRHAMPIYRYEVTFYYGLEALFTSIRHTPT